MQYGSFNAQEFKPNNGGTPQHPVGRFVGKIEKAEILPTKNNDGGYYAVTFKSDAGEIINRYNLWNSDEQTVGIARGQLSALCHAINYFTLNFDSDGGRAIIGAPIMFEVRPQRVPSDPNDKRSAKVDSPNLTEVSKVYTAAGIDPVSPNSAPVTATGATSPVAASPAPAAQQAATAPAPVPATAPAGTPWAQAPSAPAAGSAPPWATK